MVQSLSGFSVVARLAMCIGGAGALLLAAMALASPAEAQKLPTFKPKVAGKAFTHRNPAFLAGGWMTDLTGDGREELIVPFNNYPGLGPDVPEQIEVLEAHPRRFTYSLATPKIVTGIRPEFVHSRVFAEGDFNDDGRPDLFIGGHGYDTLPFAGETDKILLSNDVGSQTGIVAPPGELSYTHATASGDINGDGIDDIYVGTLCCGSSRGPYFLLGQAGGAPVVAEGRLPTAVANRTRVYTAAALTDIDGVNGLDLVLGSSGDSDNVAYLNDGTGSFAASPALVLPPGLFGQGTTITVDIAVADLNTDGRPDLLLSQTAVVPFYQGFGLQVLVNNGAGFTDESTARLLGSSHLDPGGIWAERIFVADFYGDGFADIVLSGKQAGRDTPVIWLNDGNGVFTPQSRALFDKRDRKVYGLSIFPTDVNFDRRTDLVKIQSTAWTSARTTYRVWTYVNKGPGRSAAVAPVITRPPAGVSVAQGEPFGLSVAATGQRPLAVQWFRDGIAIPGATAPVYRVVSASGGDAGSYTVRVGSGTATTTSAAVTVAVN